MLASSNPNLSLSDLIRILKQQYPENCLIAEFLTYQEGQYVVRAMVQVGSEVLSTGMAANTDIEVAEDRAKMRAIECLCCNQASQEKTSQSLPKPIPKGVHQPISEDNTQGTLAESDRPFASPNQASLETLQAPQPPPADRLEPPPSPPSKELSDPNNEVSRHDKLANPEPDNTSTGNTNLLDQIAKTDVEMRRLGWGVQQGRQSLLERYGKRSRRELTDDEVLDFLHYLEQQP